MLWVSYALAFCLVMWAGSGLALWAYEELLDWWLDGERECDE